MHDRRESESARDLLASIQSAEERAIHRLLVPMWFWWGIGAGMVALGIVVDGGDAASIAVAAVLFAISALALSSAMIFGGAQGARVRSDRLGNAGALMIVAFDLVSVAVSLVTAFGLRAVGFAFPASAGTLVGAAILVLGGPWLMGRLERIMRRDGR